MLTLRAMAGCPRALVLELRSAALRIGVMQTKAERNWTAQVVIASAHAGLRPYCALLEAEIRRVLARVDDPRVVRAYLKYLREESQKWPPSRMS